MGRGTGQSLTQNSAVRGSAGVALSTLLCQESAAWSEGEVLTLSDESQIEAQGKVSTELLEAFDSVAAVHLEKGSVYRVDFKDGNRSFVDLNRLAVASSNGEEGHGAALLAAVAHESQWAEVGQASAKTLALADAYESFQKGNTDALQEVASLASEKLLSKNSSAKLNDPQLSKLLSREEDADAAAEKPALSARLAKKARLSRLSEAIGIAEKTHADRAAITALLFNETEEGYDGPSSEQIEERENASEELGAAIPESGIEFEERQDEDGNPIRVSVGPYEVGDAELARFDIFRNRYSVGQRAFLFRGPPGSGKDAYAKEIAAGVNQPLVTFNIGPEFSWEDAIGGDGLQAKEILDDKGNVLQMAPESAQIKGPLSRALEHPAVVVIQEPEGMENEAVRMHSAFGDNVGSPETRKLTINTSAGDREIKVHPDAIIVFTYNSGPEDVKFKTALHDRACNLDFEYPEPEIEARRYAKMVTRMMNTPLAKKDMPEMAREYKPEECLAVVKLMETLRNAHRTDPDTFIEMPGARQGVHIFTDLIQQGYINDKQATETIMGPLKYLLRGSDNMSSDERRSHLSEQMTDLIQDLQKVAESAWEARNSASN